MKVSIVGWAHTKFGKLECEDAEIPIRNAARAALDDAGVASQIESLKQIKLPLDLRCPCSHVAVRSNRLSD